MVGGKKCFGPDNADPAESFFTDTNDTDLSSHSASPFELSTFIDGEPYRLEFENEKIGQADIYNANFFTGPDSVTFVKIVSSEGQVELAKSGHNVEDQNIIEFAKNWLEDVAIELINIEEIVSQFSVPDFLTEADPGICAASESMSLEFEKVKVGKADKYTAKFFTGKDSVTFVKIVSPDGRVELANSGSNVEDQNIIKFAKNWLERVAIVLNNIEEIVSEWEPFK